MRYNYCSVLDWHDPLLLLDEILVWDAPSGLARLSHYPNSHHTRSKTKVSHLVRARTQVRNHATVPGKHPNCSDIFWLSVVACAQADQQAGGKARCVYIHEIYKILTMHCSQVFLPPGHLHIPIYYRYSTGCFFVDAVWNPQSE